jgi:hypothetical protein
MTARHLSMFVVVLYVLFFAVMGSLWIPGVVSAAPLQPMPSPFSGCARGVLDQSDMVGRYESPYMLVVVSPCEIVQLTWVNAYGEHTATYLGRDRLPGGGIVSFGFVPDPKIGAYLDSSVVFLIKPAEKGWVEVATVTEAGQIRDIYRLQKTQ